jgi:vacuolar-type H+-ATPase subunit D/Vma8
LYLDRVKRERQNNGHLQSGILTTFLFADEQVIMTTSEDSLQKLLDRLSDTATTCNLFLQQKIPEAERTGKR